MDVICFAGLLKKVRKIFFDKFLKKPIALFLEAVMIVHIRQKTLPQPFLRVKAMFAMNINQQQQGQLTIASADGQCVVVMQANNGADMHS